MQNRVEQKRGKIVANAIFQVIFDAEFPSQPQPGMSLPPVDQVTRSQQEDAVIDDLVG